jgi:maltooligosyltrehalose trehalohydrolase
VGVAAHQLVVCAQNHDQIGNRAQGERLSMLLDVPQLKAIAALTLLSPFVPLLFQGEEWGARTPFLYFTDHQNAELGEAVAAGRAREFSSFSWQGAVPNPQALETFERSKLEWSELDEGSHAELYDWYRQLIRLRRKNTAWNAAQNVEHSVDQSSGTPPKVKAEVAFDADAGWLTLIHGGLLAVFNFADHPQAVPMPEGAGQGDAGQDGARPGGSRWRLVLSSDGAAPEIDSNLPAHATRVSSRDPAFEKKDG